MTHPLQPTIIPFETEPPDLRVAYLRLLEKVYRTGLYYRLCAANYQTKANNTGDAVAKAVANSLTRTADDMGFIFNKGCFVLPPEDRERIVAENPTPFAKRQSQKAS